MRHFGLSSRERLGGNDALGSLSGRYATLPEQSILTPDDPPTIEDKEFAARGWLALLGIGFALLMFGFYLLFTSEPI